MLERERESVYKDNYIRARQKQNKRKKERKKERDKGTKAQTEIPRKPGFIN